MNYRTDIAYEEITKIVDEKAFQCNRKKYKGVIMDHIKVLNEDNSLKKEIGDYYTIEIPKLNDQKERDDTASVVEEVVKEILPKNSQKILLVGLGNESVTADSLGPYVSEEIVVTSHLIRLEKLDSNEFRDVSVVVPKVMGQTGIETATLVKAICNEIKPDCVIAIDALATTSIERINRVIQISNTGIKPGGGVQNHRLAIHESTLQVPVIAIGVATVMSIQSLIYQVLNDNNLENTNKIFDDIKSNDTYQMVITPKEMDEDVDHLVEILSNGINYALYPSFKNF